MAKIAKIANEVKDILVKIPATRDSDELLYYEYIKREDERNGVSVLYMSLAQFLVTRKYLDLASIETLGRARRKIQAEYPELRGTNEKERREAEKDYVAFSKAKV